MPKLIDDHINKSDLQEFVDDYSDFSFEMEVLNSFPSNFEVEHGGTYEDPITSKFRQFDIRASHTFKDPFNYNIFLAVEAKNLSKNYPLLISSIPRDDQESYHQIIVSKFATKENERKFRPYGKIIDIRHSYNTLYNSEDFVGKSLDQIGRHATKDEIVFGDNEVYSKWTQAVNSSYDLAQNAYLFSKIDTSHKVYISVVLPIVVIPDKTLWTVNFGKSGEQLSEPQLSENCRYFIGNEFELGDENGSDTFSLSHLHFMTLSGFRNFVEDIESSRDSIFPKDRIRF